MSLETIHSIDALPPETDLLVVLGKNIGVDWSVRDIRHDPDHLSDDSRLNLEAAGLLYARWPRLPIVLSGGRTVGPGYASQPMYARDYLTAYNHFPHIPFRDIQLDEDSPDTAYSAENVAEIAQEKHYKNIGLLSVGYHLNGAATLFRRFGVPLRSLIASEDIVAEHSTEDNDRIAAWRQLARVKQEARREQVRNVLLHTVDPRGKLLRIITSRTRG